jgi:hypothetical protein
MTLSALGIFSAAGAGGGAPTTAYELISTTILGSAQASVTFDVSTFASTYKHLQIRSTTRTVNTGTGVTALAIRLNSDSGTNYSYHRVWGNGSSVPSDGAANISQGFAGTNFYTGEVGFSGNVCDILDAFSTTKNKTGKFLGGNSNTSKFISLFSWNWRNTNAITSILLLDSEGNNLATGCRFSLYGIRG